MHNRVCSVYIANIPWFSNEVCKLKTYEHAWLSIYVMEKELKMEKKSDNDGFQQYLVTWVVKGEVFFMKVKKKKKKKYIFFFFFFFLYFFFFFFLFF